MNTNKIMNQVDFLFDADLQHRGNSGDALTDAIENMSKNARKWVTVETVEAMEEENQRDNQ